MEYMVFHQGEKTILEITPDGGVISDENGALDLVALCGGEGSDLILLHQTNLHADFFDLKTGLAGKVLLKLSNYRVHAAAVISQDRIGTGRFYEFALETNRRNDFRIFSNHDEAINWLGTI